MRLKRLLFALCVLIGAGSTVSTVCATNIASGTFASGGSWIITQDHELYVDAPAVPDYPYAHATPWFKYGKQVHSIRFSARVTSIGTYAFASYEAHPTYGIEAEGLTEVWQVNFDSRPTPNVTIKAYAFQNTPIMRFDFSYVVEIGDYAFENCDFRADKNNNRIDLPAVKKIGDRIFRNNKNLHSSGNIYDISLSVKTAPEFTTTDPFGEGWGGLYHIAVPLSLYQHYRDAKIKGNIHVGGPYGEAGYWMKGNSNTLYVYLDDKNTDFNSPNDAPWAALANASIGSGLCIRAITIYFGARSGYTISKNAFANFTELVSVESESVEYINDNAFKGCSKLETVNLSKVKKIGASAFEDCTRLKTIYLSQNLTSIGSKAFANTMTYSSTNDIYAFANAPTTANDAFLNAGTQDATLYGVKKIILHVPADVSNTYEKEPWNKFELDRTVSEWPVTGMNPTWSLSKNGTLKVTQNVPNYDDATKQPWYNYREYIRDIIIDEGVTSVGSYAFAFPDVEQSHVINVSVARTCKNIGASAFRNNDALRNIYLTAVENIDEYAFCGCASVESFSFGDKLQSVGDNFLRGCVSLDMAEIAALDPPVASKDAFSGIQVPVTPSGAPARVPAATKAENTKPILIVPESSLAKYLTATGWKEFRFDIGSDHGNVVASGSYGTHWANVGGTLQEVEGEGLYLLFEDGYLLITSPTGDTREVAPWHTNASKIKEVEIRGDIPFVGKHFNNMANLTTVTLSSSIKQLDQTFTNCPNLSTINLDYVEMIDGNLGYECFSGCTALTKIDAPALRLIGSKSFKGCTGIKSVITPLLTYIDHNAFENCTTLKEANIGSANIATEAFKGCTALQQITLETDEIEEAVFEGCTALTTIYVGAKLDMIDDDAFLGTALNTIYCSTPSPAYLHSNAFNGVTVSNITLYLPQDFVQVYKATDVWKQMNIVSDPAYSEPLLPTGGLLKESGTWTLGTDGVLTVDCDGEVPAYEGTLSWQSWYVDFDKWEAYISSLVFSATTSSVVDNMFRSYYKVQTVTLGTSMQNIGANSLRFATLTDVYCYAEVPPTVGADAFNWTALTNNNATLHVLRKSGVKAKYEADANWSKFPNIVADLGNQDLPTQYEVVFLDWDGTVLRSETVNEGEDANEPMHPTRADYIFKGWDKDWHNVQQDLTINAVYELAACIEDIFAQPNAPAAVKIIRNGQILILLPDGSKYDIIGRQVNN